MWLTENETTIELEQMHIRIKMKVELGSHAY